jgi:hypothetical protein
VLTQHGHCASCRWTGPAQRGEPKSVQKLHQPRKGLWSSGQFMSLDQSQPRNLEVAGNPGSVRTSWLFSAALFCVSLPSRGHSLCQCQTTETSLSKSTEGNTTFIFVRVEWTLVPQPLLKQDSDASTHTGLRAVVLLFCLVSTSGPAAGEA